MDITDYSTEAIKEELFRRGHLRVLKATVLLRHGTDHVLLDVNNSSPFPKGISNPFLTVSFEAQHDTAVEYCRKNFGIDPEVINTRTRG